MALTFDFTNNPADASPELLLKATGASAAEKILLYNILNCTYGAPVILQEGSTQAAGMATAVKIGFVLPEPETPEPEPEPEAPQTNG